MLNPKCASARAGRTRGRAHTRPAAARLLDCSPPLRAPHSCRSACAHGACDDACSQARAPPALIYACSRARCLGLAERPEHVAVGDCDEHACAHEVVRALSTHVNAGADCSSRASAVSDRRLRVQTEGSRQRVCSVQEPWQAGPVRAEAPARNTNTTIKNTKLQRCLRYSPPNMLPRVTGMRLAVTNAPSVTGAPTVCERGCVCVFAKVGAPLPAVTCYRQGVLRCSCSRPACLQRLPSAPAQHPLASLTCNAHWHDEHVGNRVLKPDRLLGLVCFGA